MKNILINEAGFVFKQVNSQRELVDHLYLREKIYIAQYLSTAGDKEEYIASLKYDPYDDYSVYFNCYKDTIIIGTMRCVLDNKNGFPMEIEANIDCKPFKKVGNTVEIGRFAIEDEYRRTPQIILGLFKCIRKFAIFHDVYFLVQSMPERLVKTYQKIGFKKFSPAYQHYSGNLFYPGYLNIAHHILTNSNRVKEGKMNNYKNIMETQDNVLEQAIKKVYLFKFMFKKQLTKDNPIFT